MMMIMSPEQVKAWELERLGLAQSASVEDRAVAIMMDGSVGGFGQSGDQARAKVKAILTLFHTFKA